MHKILALFIVLLSVISCADSEEFVVMNKVNSAWDKKSQQKFTVSVTDSQNPKNIIFVVRNNNDYPYSNLRLIANVQNAKAENLSVDTLNYVLAKPSGEWIGSGFGETKETLFQYKINYKFPADGNYTINVTQAMRKDILPGIEDIGVKIEAAKP